MIRRVFLAAFALLFALSFFVSAQEPVPDLGKESVPGTVVANVNLSNTSILSQEGSKLTVGFTLENRGDTIQSDVRYGFELVKTTEKGQTIVDTLISKETLVLSPKEPLQKEVGYVIPSFFSGDYDLWIIARTTGGLMLGLGNAGKVTLAASGDYAEIVPESCILKVGGEEKPYSLYQGVDVSASEALLLSCDIKSHATTNLSLVPYFDTFRRSLYGEEVKMAYPQAEPITFAKGEKKTIEFAIPKPDAPQAYDVSVVLAGSQTKSPISNRISAHYVLRGASATIQNAFFNQASYKKGDPMTLSLFWTSSTDTFPDSRAGEGTKIDSVFAALRVTDESGNLCTESKKQPLFSDVSGMATLTATAKQDCMNPTATITLLDGDGAILDTRMIETPKGEAAPTTSAPTGAASLWNARNIGIGIVILLFLSALGLIIVKRRGGLSSGRFKSLLFLMMLSSGLFLSAGEAEAVSWESVPGGKGTQKYYYTANTDKISYYPNENIVFSSSASWAMCSNSASWIKIKASLSGDSVFILNDNSVTGGATTYGSGILKAPSSPGNYSILLEGCGKYMYVCSYATINVVVTSPVCAGSIPANAAAWDMEESSGLTENILWTYSGAIDNPAVKCEYSCNTGFLWDGSECVTPSTLKICLGPAYLGKATASGTTLTTRTLPNIGNSETLKAWSGTDNGICDGTDVTATTTWNDESGNNTVNITGITMPSVTITAQNIGSETISIPNTTASPRISIPYFVPAPSCMSNCDAEKGSYCQGESFTTNNSCGVQETCAGTRTCDMNWKEVTPGF